jgi:hypothetical protein
MCMDTKCISLCNPPCRAGEHCVMGECELMPRSDEPGGKKGYLGIASVLLGGLNSSAATLGEVRMEIGGQYSALQIGPAFGSKITELRAAIIGYFSFQVWPQYPFLITPTFSLGYSFGWVKDSIDSHQQDIFIVPGVRLSYRINPRLALVFDPVQLQIAFLRFRSSRESDLARLDVVPVSWNLGFGVHFLY